MARLQAVADDKQQREGDWRTPGIGMDRVEDQLMALGQQCEDLKAQAAGVSKAMRATLNPEQEMLRAAAKQAFSEMDTLGEGHYREKRDAYRAKLTPEQNAMRAEVKALKGKAKEIDERATHVYRLSQMAVVCDIPKEVKLTEPVRNILEAAFNLQRFGDERSPIPAGAHAVPHSLPQDRKFGVMLLGDCPEVELPAVSDQLERGGAVGLLLKDATDWKRVKTGGGTGYMLEVPEKLCGVQFAVANTMSRLPQFASMCQQGVVSDGVNLTRNESSAAELTALRRGRRAGRDAPNAERTHRLLLTGEAAEAILAELGVDKHRIRDAPQTGR